jgi:pyridoxamine 5'-phosphate oxidase
MILATVDFSGAPSARTVLLKGLDERGLVFYTNFLSAKGRDLDGDPRAALCFHWDPLRRQIRVQGTVSRVSESESDTYFAGRARGSQIGAWAALQSDALPDYRTLLDRVDRYEREFDGDVPRPPHWGGYRLAPHRVEFWESCADRLHRRDLYVLDGAVWRASMLYP